MAASDPRARFFRISSTDSSRETFAADIDRGFGDLGRPKKIKIKGVTEAPSCRRSNRPKRAQPLNISQPEGEMAFRLAQLTVFRSRRFGFVMTEI